MVVLEADMLVDLWARSHSTLCGGSIKVEAWMKACIKPSVTSFGIFPPSFRFCPNILSNRESTVR